MPTHEPRGAVTSAMLSPGERRVVEAAAARLGETVSRFTRTAAVERAVQVLTGTKPAVADTAAQE